MRLLCLTKRGGTVSSRLLWFHDTEGLVPRHQTARKVIGESHYVSFIHWSENARTTDKRTSEPQTSAKGLESPQDWWTRTAS